MTPRRYIPTLMVALLLQAGVFGWYQSDLLYLRRPVTAIVSDGPDAFRRHASTALSRERLTRQHLDTMAEAAKALGQPELEIESLTRRLAMDPSDAAITMRLAEAVRRSGDLARAEALYLSVLRSSQESSR